MVILSACLHQHTAVKKRGGKGVQGMGTNEDDFVEQLISTSTHDTILFFSNKGRSIERRAMRSLNSDEQRKGFRLLTFLK